MRDRQEWIDLRSGDSITIGNISDPQESSQVLEGPVDARFVFPRIGVIRPWRKNKAIKEELCVSGALCPACSALSSSTPKHEWHSPTQSVWWVACSKCGTHFAIDYRHAPLFRVSELIENFLPWMQAEINEGLRKAWIWSITQLRHRLMIAEREAMLRQDRPPRPIYSRPLPPCPKNAGCSSCFVADNAKRDGMPRQAIPPRLSPSRPPLFFPKNADCLGRFVADNADCVKCALSRSCREKHNSNKKKDVTKAVYGYVVPVVRSGSYLCWGLPEANHPECKKCPFLNGCLSAEKAEKVSNFSRSVGQSCSNG